MEKYVTGLTHKGYHVTDMKESLRFYCDCLGLQKIFDIHEDDGSDWLVYLKICDRQFIELFYGSTQKRVIKWPNFKDPKHAPMTEEEVKVLRHEIATHICFEVPDINACVKRLEEFGYPTVMNVSKGKDHNYETFVQDPDGNLIELMQYMPDGMQLMDYPQA
ncbi:MAG: VOC family protein [Clostridiales bacterium]|nr:VOC family protein [Clostridiales bacterium]